MIVRILAPAALFLASLVAATVPAVAQGAPTVVSGVVAEVFSAPDGELQGFKLLDGSGLIHDLTVKGGADPTRYGLEDRAGNRWVSDQQSGGIEATTRLRDHQQRLAPVTVTLTGAVASSVVEREEGRLSSNLTYLFAIYTVTWLAFFAFLYYLSRRQKDLQREMAALKSSLGNDKR